MLRRLKLAALAVIGAAGLTSAAEARVNIRINLASQTMEVASAQGTYVWPISSARSGYRTPQGSFGIQRMEVMHRSRKYHNSPMPHSLFFSGGYAIHGTYDVAALGQPASHGCVRLAPENAAALYSLVAAEGGRISITGASPSLTRYARRDTRRVVVARRAAPADPDAGFDPYDPYHVMGYAPVRRHGMKRWLRNPVEDVQSDPDYGF